MSTRLTLAAALAVLAASTPAIAKKPDAAPAAAPTVADPKNISKGVRPPLLEAQKLTGTGDLAGALAQVRLAEAVPDQNPTDRYYVSQIKLNVAVKQKDNALIMEALKQQIDSPFLTQPDKIKFLGTLASLEYQGNDISSATKYFEQLATLNPSDTGTLDNLSILYAQQKQFPQAIDAARREIAAKQAAGQQADEKVYRRVLALAVDNKMAAETTTASMDLVKAYPTPVNWRDALLIYQGSQKLDDQANLDLFRLMDTAGALNGERDYAEYVETAIGRGLPGEAKAALAEGEQKGMLSSTKPLVVDYNKSITARIGADRAGLAALDKEARGAANGKVALGEGDAYYGYGDYAKSAEMYRLALSKGGIDAATANLRLGAALARSGDKAGAATAFAAVTGSPRATIAQYWTVWLAKG